MRRRRALVLPAVAALAMAACGFELRRTPQLQFRRIALQGFSARSPLAQELRSTLASQVEIVAARAQAEVVLVALVDRRERTVVASTAFGQVREVQLRLRFEFRVETGSGRELAPRAELLLVRDLSYSETLTLAKEYEEAQLHREMQADVAQQVMRRLASLQI
jgi:LPS-assembly lipoprotein